MMDTFEHNRDCVVCSKTHFCAEDDFLHNVCANCYVELFKKIPDYIPNTQRVMWVERTIDNHGTNG